MNGERGITIKDKLSQLRELLGEGYAELLHAYLSDSPGRVESMSRALTQGDLEQLANAAHSLKGSSGNMGASELADMCEEILVYTRDGSHEQLHEKVMQMQQCYQAVHALLQEELAAVR